MDVYKQESQNYNQLMGGLFGMAGGAMKMSDERQKENITPMASVFAVDPKGKKKKLPIYEYTYRNDADKRRQVGPMAQDVEKIDDRAVSERDGIKYIDTDLVMGSILRAA